MVVNDNSIGPLPAVKPILEKLSVAVAPDTIISEGGLSFQYEPVQTHSFPPLE